MELLFSSGAADLLEGRTNMSTVAAACQVSPNIFNIRFTWLNKTANLLLMYVMKHIL